LLERRRSHQLKKQLHRRFKAGSRYLRMQVRLRGHQLTYYQFVSRPRSTELTRVLQDHQGKFLPGHPADHCQIGYSFRGVRPHQQAVWQSGCGNLIQQIGDHLRIGVQRRNVDPVERWKRHAADCREGSRFGSRPTIGNSRENVLARFKHCRSRDLGVNGHQLRHANSAVLGLHGHPVLASHA
jgi:hypothetical protein